MAVAFGSATYLGRRSIGQQPWLHVVDPRLLSQSQAVQLQILARVWQRLRRAGAGAEHIRGSSGAAERPSPAAPAMLSLTVAKCEDFAAGLERRGGGTGEAGHGGYGAMAHIGAIANSHP